MADLLSQNKRHFSFDSPLGKKLLVTEFSGKEAISDLFHFKLVLASEDFGIHWNQIVGRNVTVGIRHFDGVTFRYWNGFISKFAPIRHPGRLAYYSAEMVPWLWFLTNTKDCLYYQNKTVPEILEATFDKYGFQDYELNLTDGNDRHTPWDYCCQYRESAYHFVSRLMEIEGIYYFFRHEQGKHTLVMVDDKTGCVDLPYQPAFRVDHQQGTGLLRVEGTISTVDMHKVVKPTSYYHKEFNFTQPDNPLLFASNVEDAKQADQKFEVYDYPGEFEEPTDGRDWSMVRQEEQEHDRVESSGQGNGRAMMPGYRISVTEHERQEQNIDYLITSVEHNGTEGTLLPGTDVQAASYTNTFSMIPYDVQYRPKRKTEKHQMRGAQTAIVVGPKGEEIYTDKYGRVKVQFHWDRVGQFDENSSCWIRVMQPIAGPQFGHIWLPRIGQEVIVDFLEGDPDRPVITGCLYNEKNMPPYKLPDKKNWSGIKTRSTIGGTAKNYNELRFVDTKGDELYGMHAEKDMEITVNHDTTEEVDHDRSLTVKHDQMELVEGDKHLTVKGDRREDVKKDLSLNVGGKIDEKSAGNFTLESGGDIHIKAAGRIILEAANGIVFIGKGGFIDVTDQVVIQGSDVFINCDRGMPDGANSAQPQQPLAPILPASDPGTASPPTAGSQPNAQISGSSSSMGAGGSSAGAMAGGAANSAIGGDDSGGAASDSGGAPGSDSGSGPASQQSGGGGILGTLAGAIPNLGSLASNPFFAGIFTNIEDSSSSLEDSSEQDDSGEDGLVSGDGDSDSDDPQGVA